MSEEKPRGNTRESRWGRSIWKAYNEAKERKDKDALKTLDVIMGLESEAKHNYRLDDLIQMVGQMRRQYTPDQINHFFNQMLPPDKETLPSNVSKEPRETERALERWHEGTETPVPELPPRELKKYVQILQFHQEAGGKMPWLVEKINAALERLGPRRQRAYINAALREKIAAKFPGRVQRQAPPEPKPAQRRQNRAAQNTWHATTAGQTDVFYYLRHQ